jgi:hypothetical protein
MPEDEQKKFGEAGFGVVLDDIEEYEYEEYSFNGKPAKSRAGKFFIKYLLAGLCVLIIVALSPLWGPVHLTRRALGREGVFWRKGDERGFQFLGINIFWRTRETVEIVNHDKSTLN